MVVERLNSNQVGQRVEGKVNFVANADVFAVFNLVAVHENPPEFDMFLRQRPRFEKAGCPQPFVEPHGVFVLRFGHCWLMLLVFSDRH